MSISKIGLAGVAAAALLALAACGTSGSSGGESSSAPSASMSGTASSAQPSSSTKTASSQDPSSTSSAESKSSTPTKTVSITIKDFKYQMPKSVAPGTKIKVINEDSASHTITSDKGDAFDVNIPGKGSATFTAPSTPGSTPFHCTYHANMKGTLVVEK